MSDALPLLRAAQETLRLGQSLVRKDESRETLVRIGIELNTVILAETEVRPPFMAMGKGEQGDRLVAAIQEIMSVSEADLKQLKAVVKFSLDNTSNV